MSNLFKSFQRLVPTFPLRVGVVLSADDTSAVVEEVGGAQLRVIGTATAGRRVYFRNNAIVGDAPQLPLEVIEE